MRRGVGLASLLAIVIALGLAAYVQYGRDSGVQVASVPATAVQAETHYSPDENLERLDIETLERAQRSIDVAMFAFTDKYIAERLVELAQRGVRIRIYRDQSQYEQEQRNAARHRDFSTTEMFRGEPNIQVRLKRSGRRNVMHLKAFLVDGTLLRDGSANWSAAGLKAQDNSAHYTNHPALVEAFQRKFDEMWEDRDNVEIQ